MMIDAPTTIPQTTILSESNQKRICLAIFKCFFPPLVRTAKPIHHSFAERPFDSLALSGIPLPHPVHISWMRSWQYSSWSCQSVVWVFIMLWMGDSRDCRKTPQFHILFPPPPPPMTIDCFSVLFSINDDDHGRRVFMNKYFAFYCSYLHTQFDRNIQSRSSIDRSTQIIE